MPPKIYSHKKYLMEPINLVFILPEILEVEIVA